MARVCLERGDLVAIPTETVYGLAGMALNEHALVKIFETKNRPFFDPLIMHVADREMVDECVLDFPQVLARLADHFWPGPLTILLPKRNNVPDLLTAGSSLLAIRIPQHPLTLELLRLLAKPIAAPSANPFGYVSPTTAQHVADQLGDKLAYILDGGSCKVGLESSIVSFQDGKLVLHRRGGISEQELEEVAGAKIHSKLQENSNPQAPGQLDKHYATKTPLKLVSDLANELNILQQTAKSFGVLSFKAINSGNYPIEVLSLTGDDKEAARNLFASMRRLDSMGLDLIIAEQIPEYGLGAAINDRLRRAAAGH